MRIFAYLPLLIASRVSFLEYVCRSGRAMLDCPEQYLDYGATAKIRFHASVYWNWATHAVHQTLDVHV